MRRTLWSALVIQIGVALSLPGARAQEPDGSPDGEIDSLVAISFMLETSLPGTPEAVFDGITGDLTGWWDHGFSERPWRYVLEPRPGGHFIELFDEAGNGAIHADVTYAHRGRRLRFEGPLGFSGQAVRIVTTYDFEASGSDSTRLTVNVNASGTLDDGERGALRAVWQHFILNRFKPYWEEVHARRSR